MAQALPAPMPELGSLGFITQLRARPSTHLASELVHSGTEKVLGTPIGI